MSVDLHYLVAAEASRLTLQLAPQTLSLLARYVALLSHWGQRLNLTGDPSPATLVHHHLADGLVLAGWLRQDSSHWHRLLVAAEESTGAPGQRIPAVDVGSGAGLPALVLAVALPELQFTLVEPNTRKSSFLRTAIHELQLSGRVLCQRLEQVQLAPQAFACSRATFAPSRWLKLATPLLAAGGLAVAFVVRPEDIPPPPPTLTLLDAHRYTLMDQTPRTLAVYIRN